MIMKKNKTTNDVLFIDASNECIKVTNNNKLTSDNIDRIVSTYTNRNNVPHLSYVASYDEIVTNDYVLSVADFVEAEDKRERIDIFELSEEIDKIVNKEKELRLIINNIIDELKR